MHTDTTHNTSTYIRESLTNFPAPSVPTILSNRIQSYFDHNTLTVTSLGSTPSSKNGYEQNSV